PATDVNGGLGARYVTPLMLGIATLRLYPASPPVPCMGHRVVAFQFWAVPPSPPPGPSTTPKNPNSDRLTLTVVPAGSPLMIWNCGKPGAMTYVSATGGNWHLPPPLSG